MEVAINFLLLSASVSGITDSIQAYNVRCFVDNWEFVRCSFEPPENITCLALCYSPCYGCSDKAIYPCPNFGNNSCTVFKRNGYRVNDDSTYSLFVCNSLTKVIEYSSRRDFEQKTIVKPGPVKGIRSEFISNTSVRVLWRAFKRKVICEVALRDSSQDIGPILQANTTEKKFDFWFLKPLNCFTVNVKCIPEGGGFWSLPETISFKTKDEDLSGGLVKVLGFQVLSRKTSEWIVKLYWQVVNRYVTIERFNAKIYCACCKIPISISIESHARSLEEAMDPADGPCRVVLTGVTTTNASSHSELTFSLSEDLSQLSGDVPLLLTNRERGIAFLSWSKDGDPVDNVTLFFYDFSPEASEVERENSSTVPASLTMDGSVTYVNSSSLVDRPLHLSFQRMEVVCQEQVLVHGPLIPVSCGYELDGDVAPPSNLTYLKGNAPDSFSVTWGSQLNCDSRYFSHLLLEYYSTECEKCSKEAQKVYIPRFATEWTVHGLGEGPYQVRMRSECNITGKESEFTSYITVRVISKEGHLKFVLAISLCSTFLILIAGVVIGSAAVSNMNKKLYIEVPEPNDCSADSPAAVKEGPQQYLHKAKSFYKLFFPSQHTLFSSKASCLDKQDLFAWLNPNYGVCRKHSFASTPSLAPEKHPFQDREYMNVSYYKERKVQDDIDVYSSVKVLNLQRPYE